MAFQEKHISIDETVAGLTDPSEAGFVKEDDYKIMFTAGDEIFYQGDESHHAYILEDGQVELIRETEHGPIHLADLEKGSVFGEMGLIEKKCRSATARAVDAVTLIQLDKDAFFDRLHNAPDFAVPIIAQLVGQLRSTSNRLEDQQFSAINEAIEDVQTLEVKDRKDFLQTIREFFDPDKDLNAFQPDAIEIEQQPFPVVAKVTLFTIVALVFCVFSWASLTFIDVSVKASARIKSAIPNIVLQPIETSMIKEIYVKPGDVVEVGQVLAALDATYAEADVLTSQANLKKLIIQEKRLLAEMQDDDLAYSFVNDPDISDLQKVLFNRRQLSYKAKILSMREQVSQLKAEIETNKQDAGDMAAQVSVLRELEAMRNKLHANGHGSRAQYLSAKNERLRVEREQRRLISSIQRLKHQLTGAEATRAEHLSTVQAELAQELLTTQQERFELEEQLKKMKRRKNLVQLTAPSKSIVLEIADRSVGSVIQQAEKLFTLVPLDVPLIVEADVTPQDVGRISLDDDVRIMLDTLPFQKHGFIEGKLIFISEDTVDAGPTAQGQRVYRLKIEITGKQLRDIPRSFRLLPGMTGNIDIKSGNRRIITYFFYPITRAMQSSFHEL